MHEVKFGVWVRLSSVVSMEVIKSSEGYLFEYRLIVWGADGEILCEPGFDSMEEARREGHALALAASEEK